MPRARGKKIADVNAPMLCPPDACAAEVKKSDPPELVAGRLTAAWLALDAVKTDLHDYGEYEALNKVMNAIGSQLTRNRLKG